jgi:type IV pilus assembly protein PilM
LLAIFLLAVLPIAAAEFEEIPMANVRSAWGIDIGNRALKAIRLVRTETGYQIADFEVIEHEQVLSNAGDNKESLIQSALASFVQRHPSKGAVTAVSVSGVSSFARFIKLPPVEPKQIPQIVRFEAIQQIPFPLDEVEWSYQLFQNPESPDIEVGIFAMRRELINAHIKHFTDVDLNVQVVQMNPLAVYNAMYHDDRIKGTTMIVDLGAENTDLIIADGETIWLRSIPIGGNNFTDVLTKSFKLPFGKAEELKRTANTSKYARQIFQAMRPVFADLVAEIQRSIGFYSSVHRDSRIKKIVALGGAFNLAGLQKYLQQNLQIEVEKVKELAAIPPEDAKLAATYNQNLLSLVSAYGLAMQAMGDAKINSSLLPQHIRREKMWRDKTKWFGAAAALFLLGTGVAAGGYYVRDIEFKNASSTRDMIAGIYNPAQQFDQTWSGVSSGGGPDRQQIINIRSMVDYRNVWPELLADIYGTLPNVATADPKHEMAVKREQRQVIWINSIRSQYTEDLTKNIGSVSLAGFTWTPLPGTPAGQIDANVPVGSRGFYVLMTITTPNSNGYRFVYDNYVPALRKLGRPYMDQYNAANPNDQREFYIAAVGNPTSQMLLINDQNRPGLMKTSSDSLLKLEPPPQNPTNGTPGQPTNAPAGGVDPQVWTSRATGDLRNNDWTMKIPMIVMVVDSPKPLAQPGQ